MITDEAKLAELAEQAESNVAYRRAVSGVKEQLRKQRYVNEMRTAAHEVGPHDLTDEQKAEGKRLRELYQNDPIGFLQSPEIFPLSTALKPYGEAQTASIENEIEIMRNGGKLNKLMFRGSTKTTTTLNLSIWGVMYGLTGFVAVFTAGQERSAEFIEGWQQEFMSNDALYWMFPELIWAIRKTNGSQIRANSQTWNGKNTFITWKKAKIVMPTIQPTEEMLEEDPDFLDRIKGSGAILASKPWKSARGTNHRLPTGEIRRPSYIIMDDIQRDEDAESPLVVDKMLRAIAKIVDYLGGHDRTLSIVNNATPIYPNDVVEQLSEDDAWQTVRYPFMLEPSESEEMWLTEYAVVLRAYEKGNKESKKRAERAAGQFYLDNRKKLDKGAKVSWDWAFPWRDDEPWIHSAIQAFYTKLIDNEDAARSELQVTPVQREESQLQLADYSVIKSKESETLKRKDLPQFTTKLVAHVDVQGNHLFYAIAALSDNFNGHLVDWSGFPRQVKYRYTLKKLDKEFGDVYSGNDTQILYAAIRACLKMLTKLELEREDGTKMKLDRIGVDARWNDRVVRKAIRDTAERAIILPMLGDGVTAKKKPLSKRKVNDGETIGIEWKIRPAHGMRELIYDTNCWKSRVHTMTCNPLGDRESWTFAKTKDTHIRQIADHFEAEYAKRITEEQPDGGERTVDEFMLRPGHLRNDHFDNSVGIAVLGSTLGCRMAGDENARRIAGPPRTVVRRVGTKKKKTRR